MDICLFWHLSQPYFCFICLWCIYLFNRYSACCKLLYIYLGRIRDQRIRTDFVFISDCLLICFSAFLHLVLFNNFYCPTFIHDFDLDGSLKSFSKCLDKLYRYNRKWQRFRSEIGNIWTGTENLKTQITEISDHRAIEKQDQGPSVLDLSCRESGLQLRTSRPLNFYLVRLTTG